MNDASLHQLNNKQTDQDLHHPSVSIIVVGFNSRRYLDQCLSSLLAQRYPGPLELVFVDNRSSDGSADAVRERFPGIRVLESEENQGYAGGNNFGASVAQGEVLVFLNPDTQVAEGWLAELVRPLRVHSTIGMTTSKVLMMQSPDVINTCGNNISLAGITWCRGAGEPATEYVDDADVPAVSGCSFAIRSSLFQQLGGFDERFFMYLEDTDLSWRARVAGYRCRFVATSVVFHDYRLHLTPWKMHLIERNRYRMLGKHLSLRAVLALAPALAAGELVTWGYAVLNGPRCVVSKARATTWAFTQLGQVVRAKWRPIEGEVLRGHSASPPVIEGLGGPVSRFAQSVAGYATRAVSSVSLRLLPGPNETDRVASRKAQSTVLAAGKLSPDQPPGRQTKLLDKVLFQDVGTRD